MTEFFYSIVDLVLSNSENITLGVIVFVFILLLAAMVFSFVHLALKVSNRNSEDRSQERAADNTVINRLFELVDNLSDLKEVLENLNQQAVACQKAYEIDRKLNESYLTAIVSLNHSLHEKLDEDAVRKMIQALQNRGISS